MDNNVSEKIEELRNELLKIYGYCEIENYQWNLINSNISLHARLAIKKLDELNSSLEQGS